MNIKENKEQIFSDVAKAALGAHRTVDDITIIAVTKYVDVDTARKVIDTGVLHIAENRVDKFLEKYQALKDSKVKWHLIGTLQRRKVKDVINLVDYFHALDSLKLAQEIDKRAEHPIKCFLQVNVSGEPSKHGFNPNDLDEVLPRLANYSNLRIIGLMTMAPIDADEKELDLLFEKTHQLQLQLKAKQLPNMPFSDLSMGMSRDYASAIHHGSTFVRIGTSFFK
ncbi:hypothetical protein STRDD10_01372 [Streptococcus sp. DD10]|uniref:YggS family pyridoxal phosphate-dependent enzyme n=1 Tax=Streptococcus sp. DD10 TaxID=1777878 RepID=UPI00079B6960|nr:YggS family pyridoxal phosphate-dependent enzyme [Streptococcus sp. DD10]KXT73749.1 hypothetical protein STRDD10_01372 [Streptococcus sp. DD10]